MAIPFISPALRRASQARQAWKAGNKAQALLKGTGAVSDVVFPAWIGHEIHKSVKGQKMIGDELQRIHRARGFIKEALVRSGLKLIGKGVLGAGKTVAKNPGKTALIGGGAALGAGGIVAGKSIAEQAKKKRYYGPKYSYQGAFR